MLRTVTYDDEQWQAVPVFLDECMLGVLQGCIDGDSDATVAWSGVLAAAPEPPAQQPMTDEEAEALIPPVLRGVPAGNLPHVSTGYLIAMMRAVERHHGIGKGERDAG